jgi:hypothetical protein
MSETNSSDSIEKYKLFITRFLKPIAYVGVIVLILILGIFIPGITDEIVLESAWIIIVALFEIKNKIDASKK